MCPAFHDCRHLISQAIHVETDPQTISAYLIYLSQYSPVEQQAVHNDLALVSVTPAGWPCRRSSHQGCASGGEGHDLPVLQPLVRYEEHVTRCEHCYWMP